jgi:serine protease DegQ
VVSATGRSFVVEETGQLLSDMIQFDASVNPGNSGGPLVDMSGRVVGIVTGLVNPTEDRVFVGLGFAVPIESAGGVVPPLG